MKPVSTSYQQEEVILLQQLLSLSRQISTLTDLASFKRFILHKLQPLIKFCDVAILLEQRNGTAWKIFVRESQTPHDLEMERINNVPGFLTAAAKNGEVLSSIFTLKELKETDELSSLRLDTLGSTVSKYFSCSKINDDRVKGCMLLGFETKHHLEGLSTWMLDNITQDIIMAVDHLIMRISQEKKLQSLSNLLKISSAVSNNHTKKSLLHAIYSTIRPIFPFDNAGLFVYDSRHNVIYEILDGDSFPDELQTQLAQDEQLGPFPLHEANPQSWWMQDKVVIRRLEQEAELARGTSAEVQFQAGLAYGLKQMIGGPLVIGGKKIGALSFNSKDQNCYQAEHIEWFKKISEQIAIALSQIIKDDDLANEEHRKKVLITVGERLASIRTKQDLLKVIEESIKSIAAVKEVVLSLYDSTLGKVEHFNLVSETKMKNAEYKKLVSQRLDIAGGPHEQLIKYSSPRVVSVEDFLERYPNHPGMKIMEMLQLLESCFIPLRIQGRLLGMLELHAEKRGQLRSIQPSVYEGMAAQVGLTVANILINEKLSNQDRHQGWQEELAAEIATVRKQEERFLGMTKVFQGIFPLSFASFGVEVDGQLKEHWSYRRIRHDDYQVIDQDGFKTLFGSSLKHLENLREQWPLEQGIVILKNLTPEHRSATATGSIARVLASHHNIAVRVRVTQRMQVLISLFSEAAVYDDQHRSFLHGFIPVIKESFERLMLYEEINELKDKLHFEKDSIHSQINLSDNFENMIGASKAMRTVFEKISMVANTDATVLIEGETGTGKELIARAIHNISLRKKKVFVKVNCAAIPVTLFESELFGHERGAFTGATQKRVGRFEMAHGGTLFLDEVGELPLEIQAKLLRALQEKEIERVGGRGTIVCDVRIIAATNKMLAREVAAGRFRGDLFFRLNVFPIHLPPLRERKEDVALLAKQFFDKYVKEYGKNITGIPSFILEELEGYEWPGNVRELEHLIQQSIIQSTGNVFELSRPLSARSNETSGADDQSAEVKSWSEAERDNIMLAIKTSQGKIRGAGGAAELLKIHPNTLDSRMKKLGIRREPFFDVNPHQTDTDT